MITKILTLCLGGNWFYQVIDLWLNIEEFYNKIGKVRQGPIELR